jgi:hypothetical protein
MRAKSPQAISLGLYKRSPPTRRLRVLLAHVRVACPLGQGGLGSSSRTLLGCRVKYLFKSWDAPPAPPTPQLVLFDIGYTNQKTLKYDKKS